jgi:predicted dehydrogenase/threonine dehydrogenase-like Zn-dependent dehydrogenase
MKQVFLRKGSVSVDEVPSPALQAGNILVRVEFSCISTGTELSQLRNRSTPIWRKALDKPEHVKKAIDMALSQGIRKTLDTIGDKLHSPQPSGYSASGVVIGVGEGVQEFQVGDRVACAGAQCAFHAEVISVPVNLAVQIPENCGLPEASTVALGAIALQGVRRAAPTLGETFLVVGLGALGQLTLQLLKANGCSVIGVDLDPIRQKLAVNLGAMAVFSGADTDFPQKIRNFTGGLGVDGVILTASGKSEEILGQCFESCRKKGRVILVGDVPLHINRAQIYEKELDFSVSCSYGPGRYDSSFEERGQDYPLPYVRWTETRNMHAYLELIGQKKVSVSSLVEARYPLEGASDAFRDLGEKGLLTALFVYSSKKDPNILGETLSLKNRFERMGKSGHLRLGILGAGSFTKAMHGPILKNKKEIEVVGVASRQGHSAKLAAESLGASLATTNVQDLIEHKEIDAILVGTRHNLHASLALQCLKAGKNVFLEKPTALTVEELESLEKFQKDNPKGAILFTGFNRRYSPAVEKILSLLNFEIPCTIQYTMNAGFLPKDHWVHGPEGGGRNIGEACHIYDLFLALTNEKQMPMVSAFGIHSGKSSYFTNDNFSANFRFSNGSVANLMYTSMGNPNMPKESLTIFQDQMIFRLTDYMKLELMHRSTGKIETFEFSSKGHKEEWDAFLQITKNPEEWNHEHHQFLATRMSFLVENALSNLS